MLLSIFAEPRGASPKLMPDDPFEGESDLESISNAGSLDSIESDHEPPPEVEHPMSRIASAAMEDMYTGMF